MLFQRNQKHHAAASTLAAFRERATLRSHCLPWRFAVLRPSRRRRSLIRQRRGRGQTRNGHSFIARRIAQEFRKMVDGKKPAVFFDRDGTITMRITARSKDVRFSFCRESCEVKGGWIQIDRRQRTRSRVGAVVSHASNMTQCTPKCFGKSVNRL